MTMLVTGLVLFVLAHLLPALPGLKPRLVGALGAGPFKGIVSVLAAVGLGLIVWGWGSASTAAVHAPPSWARHVAWTFVPLAFVMLMAAYVPSRIGWFLGHPMSLSVVVWGAVHTFANHEWRSMVLFGTLATWGVAAWLLASLRDGFRPKARPEKPRDGLLIVVGLGLAGAVMMAHGWLYGVDVLP